jgi:hypothetical protein
MIGHLIIDISLVESCSVQARKLVAGGFRFLGKALAGGIVLWLDLEFFTNANA